MPRRKAKQENPDSESLHEAVTGIMESMGRGGLTFVARECGMTASAMKKRLKNPATAFDAPTLRAVILVMELRKPIEPDQPLEPAEHTPALS